MIQDPKSLINAHTHLITSDQQDNESYSFELDLMSLPSDRLEERLSKAGGRNAIGADELRLGHHMKSYRSYTTPRKVVEL